MAEDNSKLPDNLSNKPKLLGLIRKLGIKKNKTNQALASEVLKICIHGHIFLKLAISCIKQELKTHPDPTKAVYKFREEYNRLNATPEDTYTSFLTLWIITIGKLQQVENGELAVCVLSYISFKGYKSIDPSLKFCNFNFDLSLVIDLLARLKHKTKIDWTETAQSTLSLLMEFSLIQEKWGHFTLDFRIADITIKILPLDE